MSYIHAANVQGNVVSHLTLTHAQHTRPLLAGSKGVATIDRDGLAIEVLVGGAE